MSDAIFDDAFTILRYHGEVKHANAIRVTAIYEDDKILIDGLYPFDLYNERLSYFQSLFIGLLIPNRQTTTLEKYDKFALPARGGAQIDPTPVYFVEGDVPLYYRPGHWEKYLADLAEKIREQVKITEGRNRQAIDDEAFFRDK